MLLGFNALLNAKIDPIKKDIARLEVGQAKLDARLTKLDDKLDKILAKTS